MHRLKKGTIQHSDIKETPHTQKNGHLQPTHIKRENKKPQPYVKSQQVERIFWGEVGVSHKFGDDTPQFPTVSDYIGCLVCNNSPTQRE